MRNVVAAIGMTHTPGLGNRLDLPPQDQVGRIIAGFEEARSILAAARPDLIIALVNDHFDMFCLNNMPTFAVGVADQHWGPSPHTEDWLQMKRGPLAGHPDYAMAILRAAVEAGFDVTRCGSSELVHNVMLPLRYLRPERDLPVVPIFTNCFAPPLPSFARCHALGRLIATVVAQRPERVALIASGGISHWPPFAKEADEGDDELKRRMLKAQREGPGGLFKDPELVFMLASKEAEMAASRDDLINVAWDRKVLAAFDRADADLLCAMTYDEVERDGGNGGHEMAMWVTMMGALDGLPSRTLFYEPVKEWMGGVGVISYDAALSGKH